MLRLAVSSSTLSMTKVHWKSTGSVRGALLAAEHLLLLLPMQWKLSCIQQALRALRVSHTSSLILSFSSVTLLSFPMCARRFLSRVALLWLAVCSCTQAARSSYESLYSGSGYMLQTDTGNPPYSVAGRFVVGMRRSFFNVAGGYPIVIMAPSFTLVYQTTHHVLQHLVAQHVQAGARTRICAGRYAQQA